MSFLTKRFPEEQLEDVPSKKMKITDPNVNPNVNTNYSNGSNCLENFTELLSSSYSLKNKVDVLYESVAVMFVNGTEISHEHKIALRKQLGSIIQQAVEIHECLIPI